MTEWFRENPWRQGQILTAEAATKLSLAGSSLGEENAVVVISHDCDLAQLPDAEPFVEVIVGRVLDQADGNFAHAKNVRRLHLPFTAGENKIIVDLIARDKQQIDKRALAGHTPAASVRLTADEHSVIQRWLARGVLQAVP